MIREKLEDYVRTIPDFPEPGIMFRDITTILSDADGLKLAIDEMQRTLDGVDFGRLDCINDLLRPRFLVEIDESPNDSYS